MKNGNEAEARALPARKPSTAKIAVAVLLLAALAFAGCVQTQQQPTPTQQAKATPSPTLVPTFTPVPLPSPASTRPALLSINLTVNAPSKKYFVSKIVEARQGESAFDVFAKGVEMGFKKFSFGNYVYSVNGINESNAEGLYWQYYFNGKLAPLGVSDYKLSQDGVLEWRLEKSTFNAN